MDALDIERSVRLDSWSNTFKALGKLRDHPYILVGVVALLLRLIFLALMLGQTESVNDLSQISADSSYYWSAAGSIATDADWDTRGVLIFGPGYPTFLALGMVVGGANPLILLLIQVLISTLICVLLAELAFQLTEHLPTAIVAGLLAATSLTSISLANVLLSDTVYLAIVLGSFLMLISSVRRGHVIMSACAGGLLGLAALTRSIGMFALVLIPFLVLAVKLTDTSAAKNILKCKLRAVAIAAMSMMLVTGVWMLRNYIVYDVPMVSQAPSVARMRLSAFFMSHIEDVTFDQAITILGDSVTARAEVSHNKVAAFGDIASETFARLVQDHPTICADAFLENLNEAVHTDWGVLFSQFPRWSHPITDYLHRSMESGIRYRVAVLSFLGLIILLLQKRFALAGFLFVVYAYFGLATGMSLWQGTRIFHPAIMAWAILISIALTETIRFLSKLASGYRDRLRLPTQG